MSLRSRSAQSQTAEPERRQPHRPIANVGAIVMAAGLGKRMRSKLAKVLHPVLGRPMLLFAVELAERVASRGVAVVVGHQGDRVKEILTTRAEGGESHGRVMILEQRQQLGTGHAVLQARTAFLPTQQGPASTYVILNGDTPLMTEATVRRMHKVHQTEGATMTILTAFLDDPSGYGRVVRSCQNGGGGDSANPVLRIVEDRDATSEEATIREVNVGTYVVDSQFLFEALDKLQPANAQKEYYLTDLVGMAVERGLRVIAVTLGDAQEGLGINSRRELATAERLLLRQVHARWLEAGVTLHDPATIWIDADVTIGQDTVVYPNVAVEGNTSIGQDCVIRSHVRLTDCEVGDRVVVQDCSVLREAKLEDDSTVGPFAHLRPGSIVRRHAKVGNFVEMKHAELGEGSKANHLTYLGDSRIGRKVNIGAGTVTCNYDGKRKHQTVIQDDVFVGSDALLIAPVTVGPGSIVAAGSVVTEDVPGDALAIARARQVNRPGWAAKRRAVVETGGEERKRVSRGSSRAGAPIPQSLAKPGRRRKKAQRKK